MFFGGGGDDNDPCGAGRLTQGGQGGRPAALALRLLSSGHAWDLMEATYRRRPHWLSGRDRPRFGGGFPFGGQGGQPKARGPVCRAAGGDIICTPPCVLQGASRMRYAEPRGNVQATFWWP
jgi:hypothetical protein